MRGILSRPGDTPSEREEATIARIAADRDLKLAEIDSAIARAQSRQHAYLAVGKMRDAEIQQQVKDRRLDERRAIMGLVGRHG